MFDVLIVDDEPKARRGISGLISTRSAQWSIVGECEDGLQALDVAGMKKPHLVITDIRMPRMEGIEFIDKLREASPDSLVIILSGYGHFEYAKQAIKYKVFDFLRKPLDEEEFFNALDKARSEIIKNLQDKQNSILLEESLVKYKDSLFNELLEFDNQEKIVKQIHERTNIRLDKFQVVLIEAGMNNAEISIRDLLVRLLEESGLSGQTFIRKEGRWVMIVSSHTALDKEHIKDFAIRLVNRLNEDLGISVSIGISDAISGLHNLNKAYMAAYQAAKRELFHGRGKVFLDSEKSFSDRITYPAGISEKLTNCIQAGDIESSLSYTKKIISTLHASEYSIYQIEEFVGKLLVTFINAADHMMVDNTSYEAPVHKLKQIDKYHDAGEIEADILALCSAIAAKAKGLLEKRISRRIEEALTFIDKNFCRDLSLEEVSRKVDLNASYLSNYFKTETGVNFVDYITRRRVEKAKELLVNTNMKVFEISEALGYNDPKYFTRIFKKVVGVSTTEYRNYSLY